MSPDVCDRGPEMLSTAGGTIFEFCFLMALEKVRNNSHLFSLVHQQKSATCSGSAVLQARATFFAASARSSWSMNWSSELEFSR